MCSGHKGCRKNSEVNGSLCIAIIDAINSLMCAFGDCKSLASGNVSACLNWVCIKVAPAGNCICFLSSCGSLLAWQGAQSHCISGALLSGCFTSLSKVVPAPLITFISSMLQALHSDMF